MVKQVRKSLRTLFRAVNGTPRFPECNPRWRTPRKSSPSLEQLETRRMLALISPGIGFPLSTYDSTGVVTYDPTTDNFDLSATPLSFFNPGPTAGGYSNATNGLQIHFQVDASGALIGGVAGDDLVLSGDLDTGGTPAPDVSGILLTGEITAFGFQDTGSNVDAYDMRFTVTGGAIAGYFAGKDIGITVTSENSTFTGVFDVPFTGGAKGNLGPTDKLGRISGFKYTDITGDGLSNDDTPLAGTTIDLYLDRNNNNVFDHPGDDDPAFRSTTTAADGSYSFDNLPVGRYFVQEEVPAGYEQTAPAPAFYTVDVTLNSDTGNLNFTNFEKFKISGAKYNDLNGNGVIDSGDPGLGNFVINLYRDDNHNGMPDDPDELVGSVTTDDATGAYEFDDLGPGTYLVQEVGQAEWVQTLPGGNLHTVQGTSGTDVGNLDFANFQTFKITGTKYEDLKGDGIDAADAGLGGFTIKLFKDDGDGSLDAGDPQVGMTTTAGDGSYTFDDLGPGRYFVTEMLPSGWVQTAPLAGFWTVDGTSGTDVGNLDFANFKKFNLSGKKYTDCNGNGIIDSGDTGLGGVTIKLFMDMDGDGNLTAADGAAIASVNTASNGSWSFSNLGPGTYFVQEVVPSGYVSTFPIPSTYTIGGISGTDVGNLNFANFKKISLSGKKYKDLTGNGISSDDTAFAGVTINLYRDANNNGTFESGSDTFISSTMTASNGTYSFSDLGPGTYFVTEDVPAGYSQTAPTSGLFKVIPTSGNNVANLNFANYLLPPKGKIYGYKYKDLCGDGLTSDDTGYGGVTIKLYKDLNNDGQLTSADGSAIATTTTDGNGYYSFSNVALAKYLVQEVVPTGWVRTAPALSDYYAVNVNAAGNFGSYNFANFKKETCYISNIKYYVNNCLVSGLGDNTHQNSVIKVTFTVPAGVSEMVSLISYKAPAPNFDPNTASQQTIYQVVTNTYGPGTYTIQVNTPDCYYQVDFVCGCPITHFGPAGSNIFYTQQGRLISADNDGTNSCVDYMSAKCSFWNGTNGQNLCKKFNQVNGNDPTNLGNWLGATFPKLYGSSCGTNNMVGKKNSQVAAYFKTLYAGGSSKATETQVLATALNIYASTTSLGGTAGVAFGFAVNANGLGAAQFSTLNDGAAFGVGNNVNMSVKNLLLAVNNKAVNGVLYSGMSNATTMKSQANDLLGAVNQYGDIV